VANLVNNIRIIPTASHNGTTIRVAGVVVLSGRPSQTISLLVRTITVTIACVAEDPTFTRTYRIRITRVACMFLFIQLEI